METNSEYIKSRVTEAQVVDGFTACWLWNLSISNVGYGQSSPKRGSAQAHRLSYMAFVGPIPDGWHVDHLCRNKHCVNPEHLEAVTHSENLQRGHESRTGRRGTTYQRKDGLWIAAICLQGAKKVFGGRTEEIAMAKREAFLAKG